ncbi:MAG: metal dependent phosphohydrolase [Candidatus Frackibacter sp. T328-2]|nr:MAG: metal dependent phosphohydrolase [Candidatus Frackibacter sp. T328-2]
MSRSKTEDLGYPSGLIGEEIPLLARITCIADAWDAMTTDKELKENAGIQFDAEIITRLENSSFQALT